MDDASISLNLASEKPAETPSRSRSKKARSKSSHSEGHAKSPLIPVTVQLPRDVVASFDQFSAVSGVNRQHLMREALAMYAVLLGSNCRVHLPVVVNFVPERAA